MLLPFQKLFNVGALLILAASFGFAQGTPIRGIMTNRDVVILAKAGFDEIFLTKVILSSRRDFDTSAEGLAQLATEGIRPSVIEAMMKVSADPAIPASRMPASPAQGKASIAAASAPSVSVAAQAWMAEYPSNASPSNLYPSNLSACRETPHKVSFDFVSRPVETIMLTPTLISQQQQIALPRHYVPQPTPVKQINTPQHPVWRHPVVKLPLVRSPKQSIAVEKPAPIEKPAPVEKQRAPVGKQSAQVEKQPAPVAK